MGWLNAGRSRLWLVLALVVWGAGQGCSVLAPWVPTQEHTRTSAPSDQTASEDPASEPDKPADSQASDSTTPQLEEVLDRLERQGRLTPEQRAQLATDLAMVDRSAWPILIQYFLATAPKEPAEKPSSAPGSEHSGVSASAGSSPPGSSGSAGSASSQRTGTRSSGAAGQQGTGLPRSSPGPGAPGSSTAGGWEGSGQAALGKSSQSTGKPQTHPDSSASAWPQQRPSSPPPAPSALSPEDQLKQLLGQLEQQGDQAVHSPEELRRAVLLRMLYLFSNRTQEALRPIEGLPAAQQQYWIHQLYALKTYLDAQSIRNSSSRATEACRHLEEALYHLGTAGHLVVKNLTLCTAVRSYGVVEPFKEQKFSPGQAVLLYAELENFSVEETPQGYRTTLRASYEIYDARGNRVASEQLPQVEDRCRNRRRDFFVSYRIQLPQRIYPGPHKLQLTIEDVQSGRLATGTVEFEVEK